VSDRTDKFTGRPVTGDRPENTSMVEQANTQLFIDAMDALLAHPRVKAVRWTQYTPGFNDGEPCTFDGHSPEVCLTDLELGDEGLETERDHYEDGDEVWLSEYDMYEYPRKENGQIDWDQPKIYKVGGVDTTEINELLSNFAGCVEGGRHDVWMNRTFGDPAEVVATPEGFEVSFYDCGY